MSKLFNIYGMRKSKSGNGYNVTLLSTDKETREFANLFVKNENIRQKDNQLYILLPVKELKDFKNQSTIDDLPS